MLCFDCAQRGGEEPAVAVCQECGAGLCPAHTTAVAQLVHRAAGMGPVSSSVPGRRMTCRDCRLARRSA
ncbi:DUF2180 family protein [Streptomyces formicae]|uniref:DUF2180 family protein n=1 Tax=Streptomyces formicae TaxID=1616117 RepID=A0ABY3WQL4_9ACTN|nr:DUF2180 family protein [Streptomyces formicae]UNM14941.1 DUF2180 family protein [Streptomyces formicae]